MINKNNYICFILYNFISLSWYELKVPEAIEICNHIVKSTSLLIERNWAVTKISILLRYKTLIFQLC